MCHWYNSTIKLFYYFLCFISSCVEAAAGVFAKYYDRRSGHISNSNAIFNLIPAVISTVYFAVFMLMKTGCITIHDNVFGYMIFREFGHVLGTFGYLAAIHRGFMLITIVVGQMGALIPIVFSIARHKDPATIPMIADVNHVTRIHIRNKTVCTVRIARKVQDCA